MGCYNEHMSLGTSTYRSEEDVAVGAMAELERVKADNERLRRGIKRAMLYAGDNLPANTGLTIVGLLEDALKESRDD